MRRGKNKLLICLFSLVVRRTKFGIQICFCFVVFGGDHTHTHIHTHEQERQKKRSIEQKKMKNSCSRIQEFWGEIFWGKYQKNRFVGPAERTVFSIGIDCFCFWDLISFLECVCVLSNRKKKMNRFIGVVFLGGLSKSEKCRQQSGKLLNINQFESKNPYCDFPMLHASSLSSTFAFSPKF